MALNKLKFNSINVTPAASKAIRFNSSANGLETADAGGNLVKIATTTASSSASLSFTSGIDSTYKEYMFFFNNLHPQTDDTKLVFQTTTDGSNFNTTLTNTYFVARNQEDNSSRALGYSADDDQAQGTAFQRLNESTGSDNDQSISGHMHLFEPSSTTFVKHYISRTMTIFDRATDVFGAGFFNTTSAITGIQFKMSSGNIDSGTITMYGVR
mgnify:FL=1|jgi:hypothetical protein|tara:strand:+ start:1116 stop:1751 length:636 start_codon:yes stop_codon:yes gene_type:complete